jgi:Uma2 family endonuclease
MNEQLRPTSLPLTTQAAEGLVRRRFTVAEIERMVAGGIIAEDERIELIGGEVVPMSPKGARHEIIRSELAFHMSRQAPATLRVAAKAQFNLTDDTYVVPDILVYPAAIKLPRVRGSSALLVIEIADSSLAYDLDTKAALYAAHEVREYWVIDAKTLETRVHRASAPAGYADVAALPAGARLTPSAASDLAISLGDLELD